MTETCNAPEHTAECRDRHDRTPMTNWIADALEAVQTALRFAPPGHGRELLEQAADELVQAGREFDAASS